MDFDPSNKEHLEKFLKNMLNKREKTAGCKIHAVLEGLSYRSRVKVLRSHLEPLEASVREFSGEEDAVDEEVLCRLNTGFSLSYPH